MVIFSLYNVTIYKRDIITMGGIFLGWLVGGAIAIILVIATSTIERTLKSIKEQNNTIIELLKEINNKK
jgi:sensor histidine kinase YesM